MKADVVSMLLDEDRHSYRYMRLGTRWQFPNGITIEATRMKAVRDDMLKKCIGLVRRLLNLTLVCPHPYS